MTAIAFLQNSRSYSPGRVQPLAYGAESGEIGTSDLLRAVADEPPSLVPGARATWVLVDGDADPDALAAATASGRCGGTIARRAAGRAGLRMGLAAALDGRGAGQREPARASDFEVDPGRRRRSRRPSPTARKARCRRSAIHLGVRLREKVVGQVIVLPGDDGVAGIYSMGVAPKVQGRGIGLALTKAALRAAWEQGCDGRGPQRDRGRRTPLRPRGLPLPRLGPDLVALVAVPPRPSARRRSPRRSASATSRRWKRSAPTEAEASTPLPGGVIPLGLAAWPARPHRSITSSAASPPWPRSASRPTAATSSTSRSSTTVPRSSRPPCSHGVDPEARDCELRRHPGGMGRLPRPSGSSTPCEE